MSLGQIVSLIVGIGTGLLGLFYRNWKAAEQRADEEKAELDKLHKEALNVNANKDTVNSMSDDAVTKRLHDEWRRK